VQKQSDQLGLSIQGGEERNGIFIGETPSHPELKDLEVGSEILFVSKLLSELINLLK
jgi:hypothetical protein